MSNVAAIHWHATNKTISMCVIDDTNSNIYHQFTIYPGSTSMQISNAMQEFEKMLLISHNLPNKTIRYKIEHAHPVSHFQHGTSKYRRNALTKEVHDQFDVIIASTVGISWTNPNQTQLKQKRSLLRKPHVTKFRNGLKSIRFAKYAWHWHLWSIALDATVKTHQKKLQITWKAYHGITRKNLNVAEKLQFATWYAAL